jgi:hypothetical protein
VPVRVCGWALGLTYSGRRRHWTMKMTTVSACQTSRRTGGTAPSRHSASMNLSCEVYICRQMHARTQAHAHTHPGTRTRVHTHPGTRTQARRRGHACAHTLAGEYSLCRPSWPLLFYLTDATVMVPMHRSTAYGPAARGLCILLGESSGCAPLDCSIGCEDVLGPARARCAGAGSLPAGARCARDVDVTGG